MKKQATRRPTHNSPKLALLGGFCLVVKGSSVSLPIHAQRVLAYLSLSQPRTQPGHPRPGLAERLWSDVPADRSYASLRTALWRIRQADKQLVLASRDTVQLGEKVEVDVRRCIAQANRVLTDGRDLQPQDTRVETLRGELLPAWEEDWLLLERERVRQIQIHALEALARRLCTLGRRLEAIEAAYAAIGAEPFRESAHAALIDILLAEGNAAQARHHLDRYSSLLWAQLGLRPSASLIGRVPPQAASQPPWPTNPTARNTVSETDPWPVAAVR
jgi:DNA-binding SARP family transcriptional activator